MIPIDQFPFSDHAGADTHGINTLWLQQLARQSNPLNQAEIQAKLSDHHLFLRTGGAGGTWKTILLKGLVLGIYNGADGMEGEQASFEQKHVPMQISFATVELPFSNFCSVFAPKVDFSKANLSHCLFTDALLEKAKFTNTNLSNCDFSRANLSGADFINANCTGADFENCNLRGADFTNACLRGARFPGADLEGVVY